MQLACKSCGSSLKLVDKTHAICPYCGQTFLIDEATGLIVDFKIDYGDSVKVGKTIRGVKSTLILFLVVAVFEAILLLVYNMAAQNSELSSTKQVVQIEEEGNLLRMFCKDIFGKEYNEITEEEFASIKYICYETERKESGDYDVVYYSFSNYEDCASEAEFLSTVERWTVDSNGVSWPSDFTMFTGLTRIEVKDSVGLNNQEYSKEAHISYVETDSYLSGVSETLNPKDIKVLRFEGNVFPDSLDGIAAYTNLEELKIDIFPAYFEMDISGIGACSKLKTLHLDCGTVYAGLQEIGELQELESLYLNHVNLSDCDFLSKLPQLEELSVATEEEPDLTMAANLPQLRKLILLNEEKVASSEIAKLQSLIGLEELKIATDSEEAFALLAKFTSLRSLDVKFGVDFAKSRGENTEPVDIAVFAGMKHLESFRFLTDDICEISGVDQILNMPQLQALEIGEQYADFEQTVILLDPNLLLDSPSITELSLGHCYFADPFTREHIGFDFFAHYPNLQVLHLDGCGIIDLSFVENYRDLRICSLRENFIQDFSPLQACRKLEAVDIYGNQTEYHGLSEEVTVYNSFSEQIETDKTAKYSD